MRDGSRRFQETFGQGTFDKVAIQTLFGHIKSTLVDAGFQVILDTADAIDVMPMALTRLSPTMTCRIGL